MGARLLPRFSRILPEPAEFQKAVEEEAILKGQLSELGPEREYPLASTLSELSGTALLTLTAWFSALARLISEPDVNESPWVAAAISDVAGGTGKLWRQLADLTRLHAKTLADMSMEVAGVPGHRRQL